MTIIIQVGVVSQICLILPESLGTSGDDEEFLECKPVSGMLSSVDHIEAGDGKNIGGGVSGDVGVVLPERNSPGGGTGLTGGKRNCNLFKVGNVSRIM